MMETKRGLSPVIATMLLISIALVLAIIIFLWAKSFVAEKVQKDLGSGPEPIEVICERIDFEADAIYDVSENKIVIDLVNKGNIPLYELDIRKKGLGSLKTIGTAHFDYVGRSVLSGETRSATISTTSVGSGDSIEVIPVILGESQGNTKGYPCEQQGVEVTLA